MVISARLIPTWIAAFFCSYGLGYINTGISLSTMQANAYQQTPQIKTNYQPKSLLGQRPMKQDRKYFRLPTSTQLNSETSSDDTTVSWKSYGVLGMLLTTFAVNQLSRQAIYYLCDFSATANAFTSINKELDFSPQMYGELASLGFTLSFALVSLFAGNVSDKLDRNKVIALSCVVWSLSTALHGQVASFQQLIPLRVIVGASQAFFNPAAYTLLADLFPVTMLGSINGIFSSGIYLGGALASLSIILDNAVGWRVTMNWIGGVGVVVAMFCLAFIPEPRKQIRKRYSAHDLQVEVEESSSSFIAQKRGQKEDFNFSKTHQEQQAEEVETADIEGLVSIDSSSSSRIVTSTSRYWGSIVESLGSSKEALDEVLGTEEARLLFAASALRFCAGFALIVWKAPFIFAKFPGSQAAFAGGNAVVVAVGGFFSSLVGGYISDRLSNPSDTSKQPISRSWVPAIGSFLAAPFWAAFVMSPYPELSVGFLLLEYLAAECWFGPTLASIFSVVPPNRKGSAQGLFSLLTAAGNIAPVLVGMLVEGFTLPTILTGGVTGRGAEDVVSLHFELGMVLIAVVSGAYILSGILFLLVARREDKKISLAWSEPRV